MWGDDMQRTTIMLPRDLKVLAANYSEKMGVSLGQLIRDCLRKELDRAGSNATLKDCFFEDKAVYQGNAPSDLSVEHDEYLYGTIHDIH